jgi:hypothetical protein
MPAVPPARQDQPTSDPHHTPSDQRPGREREPEHRPELGGNSVSAADHRPETPEHTTATSAWAA